MAPTARLGVRLWLGSDASKWWGWQSGQLGPVAAVDAALVPGSFQCAR